VKDRLWTIGIVLMAVAAMASCDRRKVYDSYVHSALSGWERNDTVSFGVPAVDAQGLYDVTLKMRTDNSFPFTNVMLVVDQTVIPSHKRYSDTLYCAVANRSGHSLGNGINLYHHEFHVAQRRLNAGDSLYISVRHNMMREILPGITDVGIMVRRQ